MDCIPQLKALSDPNRLSILKLLLENRYCVRALSKQLQITEAAISQHIRVLKEAGFLVGKKQGYFMHYEVNRETLRSLAKEIESMLEVSHSEGAPVDCSVKPHCQCKSGKSNKNDCCHSKKGKDDGHS